MLGWPEIALIFVILILVVGPGKIPEIAKTLGEAMREFQKASTGLEQNMKNLENQTAVVVDPRYRTNPAPDTSATAATAVSTQQTTNPTATASSPDVKKDNGLAEIAEKLGISPEDKPEFQLMKEIVDKLDSLKNEPKGGEERRQV